MSAALLPWIKPQFCDAAGNPVASGKLYTFLAGTDDAAADLQRRRPRRSRTRTRSC